MKLIKQLVKIANELDSIGLHKDADAIDAIAKKMAGLMENGADKLDKIVSSFFGVEPTRHVDNNQLLEMVDIMDRLESDVDDQSLVWSVRMKKAQHLQQVAENILKHPSAKKLLDPVQMSKVENLPSRMQKKIQQLGASLSDYRTKKKNEKRQQEMGSAFEKIKE